METILFSHVNVFDGEQQCLLTDRDVLIADGIIRSVSAGGSGSASAQETVDARAMTLLPGLMDCHANIVGLITEEQKYGVTPKTIASSTLRGIYEGRNCIRAGVTTIRVDTAGHHGTYALRDAFDKGMFTGPHMLVPGRAICTTCGHGWNFGNHVADGPWEVRKAVREEIMAGADWIKLMITGGAGTSTERMEDQQMCREEIAAGVNEAHARGKKCFAHLSIDRAINDAVDAGIDSVEHGIIMEKATAEKLARTGTYLVPTLGVYRRLVDRGEKGLVPDYMYRKSMQIVERHALSFRYALEAGVKIASGTDSGQDWFPLGTSMLRELEIMCSEGMTPAAALAAATGNAADLLEIADAGRIGSGMRAEVLVVEGFPTERISDIWNTRYVLKDGQVVYRGGKEQNEKRWC